jgi:nucleoid DNA-binding protein
MKPNEIVQALKTSNPKLLGNIDDKKVARIITAALAQIKLEITTSPDGKAVAVPGLGVFKVKKVEREKDGEKRTVERVMFRIAKNRAGKKKAAAAE